MKRLAVAATCCAVMVAFSGCSAESRADESQFTTKTFTLPSGSLVECVLWTPSTAYPDGAQMECFPVELPTLEVTE